MPKAFGTPGPRAIYPDVCTSRSLAACSIRAQLLFDRLVSQADDQGRLEGNATVVKAICVPLVVEFTPRTVDLSLDELARNETIIRYQSGIHDLIQLVTWWRWQAGMRRAYPSRWPAPDGWSDVVFGLGGDTPATYRDAVRLPKSARTVDLLSGQLAGSSAGNLPADSGQLAGNLPTLARAGLGAPAQPLPVPSAGAGAYSPPTPAERGRREDGTNPRSAGRNPRAVSRAEELARRDRASRRQQAYLRHLITAEQLDEMNERDAPLDELPAWEDVETPPSSWFGGRPQVRDVVQPGSEAYARRRSQAIETLRSGILDGPGADRLRQDYGISDEDLGMGVA